MKNLFGKNTTSLRISEIALDCSKFSWTMLSGSTSSKDTFIVSTEISEFLRILSNPVTLYIESFHSLDGKAVNRSQVTFQNLNLQEITEAVQPWLRTWTIADQRYKWETLTITRYYSIHWGSFDKQIVIENKDRRFADFGTIGKKRYAKWSLKKPGTNKMLVPTSEEQIGLVWSAYSVVLDILENELGIKNYVIDGNLKDNKYPIENLIWDGASLTNSLQSMLNVAEMGMYQGPDGKIHLFDILDEIKVSQIINQPGYPYGSSVPIKQDLSRIRPKKVIVYFDREFEIRFNYLEDSSTQNYFRSTSSKNSIPKFDLENILPLPDRIMINGELVPAGSWVKVGDAIDAWEKDTIFPQPLGIKISMKEVQRYWLGDNFLDWRYSLDPKRPKQFDEKWANRIATLRAHYRKTYRPVEFWRKRIREIRSDLATKLDPATGYRAPATVFLEYCEVPTFLAPIRSKFPSKFASAHNFSNYEELLEGKDPSPIGLQIIDERLQIFRIEFLRDPDFMTLDYVMGHVDNIPNSSLGTPFNRVFWNDARLKKTFNLSVIMSVIFAVPNNNDNKHAAEYEIKSGSSKVVQHLQVRSETARFAYKDNMKAIFDGEKIVITGAEFANEKVINEVGKAEVERLKFVWEDRIIGIFSRVGYEEGWVPFAWANSVSIEFSEENQIETVFNMSEPPIPFDVMTIMPQYVKNILNKSPDARRGI